jgi:hypothetical protein
VDLMRKCVLIGAMTLMLALPAPAIAVPAGAGADVQVLHADGAEVVLELHTVGATLEELEADGAPCQIVRTPSTVQAEEPGRPQLPLRVVLLGVPPQAELALEVVPLRTTNLPGRHDVCPAPEQAVEQGEDGSFSTVVRARAADRAVYQEDSFYPSELVQMDDLGFVRSQRIVRLAVSPFQINPLTGELRQHERLRVVLRFLDGTRGAGPVKEPQAVETALNRVLLNYDAAKAWRGAASSPATAAWTPPDPGYKIAVQEEGIYELSRAMLASAGLPVDTLDPRTLQLFVDGQEVAIAVSGEGDGRFDEGDLLLFYGHGVDTLYTDTNIYWLSYGTSQGVRMAERPSLSGGAPSASYPTSVHLEDNLAYLSSLPMEEGADHWYGARIDASGTGNASWQDYDITVDQMASGVFTATLEASLAGNYKGIHHLRLYVNGQQVYDDSWYGRTVQLGSAAFSQDMLSEGQNTVRVELANDTPGQTLDMAYVNWLRLGYVRGTVADEDVLAFTGEEPGYWQYQLSGFSGPDLELFDVTDPLRVCRLTGASVSRPALWLPLLASGSDMAAGMDTAAAAGEQATAVADHTLRFGDGYDGGRRYLAQTTAQRLAPLSIELDVPSALQSPVAGADYVIITHSDFADAIQPLAAHRQAQGLRTHTVDVQDVYDEFGYGLMSSEAIRGFLAFAYDNWPGAAPSYVLLVGDGTYDFRHHKTNTATTYMPPYLAMVDANLGETAADNRFAAVAGDDILPDLSVGRLPATRASEVEAMVSKILNYETSPAVGDWNHNVLFVADDLEGGGGDFYRLSDEIADGYADPPTNTVKLLPESYAASKVYLGRTCPDENPATTCKQEIVDTLNDSGALLVSFVGHATKQFWAAERLLDIAGLRELNNGDKLPIALPMTCLEGYFHEAQRGEISFGEGNLLMPNAGAVASWSPTGLGVSSGHDYLERGLFLALFHDGVQDLGPATDQAKLFMVATAPPGSHEDLLDTYLLLGDPALQVHTLEP